MKLGTTEMKIELTSKGKTLAVLTGTAANVVDRAVIQAMVTIAKEETSEKTVQIGDDSISIKEIKKIKDRNWTDSDKPEGFSYSETILLIIKEMEAKGITIKQEKVEYMRKRLIELRRQARSQKSGCQKATA